MKRAHERAGADVSGVAGKVITWRSGFTSASRRSLSIISIALVAASLAACASRPESGYLSPVALVAPGAVDHTILVATTRERDPRPGTLFNGDRASAID